MMTFLVARFALAAIAFMTAYRARKNPGGETKMVDDDKPAIDADKPANPSPAGAQLVRPSATSWSVRYDRVLGALGKFEQITIWEEGIATSWLTGSIPPRQEIGFFRTMIPLDEVARVRALVRASDYLKVGHNGPMVPDTPTTRLREGKDVSTFIPGTPRPPAVQKVFAALEEIGKQVRNHPFKVLRGEAMWEPVQKRGDHLEIKVAFRGVGTELITPDNPLGSASPTWVGLDLIVAKDKLEAELDWEKDVQQITIVRGDLLTADGKLPKHQPSRLTLPSGAEFRFIVRRKLLLPEGQYTGTLIFIGGSDDRDGKVIEGSLRMDLGRMRVTR
jgi:hypothetical protein